MVINNFPKTINWCWFGLTEMSDQTKLCIESWKEHMPDWEIKCWDSTILKNAPKFVSDAMNDGNFGFASDWARVYIIYKYGGIYLDSDIFLYKSLEDLCNYPSWFVKMNSDMVSSEVFGGIKNNFIFFEILKYYMISDYKKAKISPIVFGNVISKCNNSEIIENSCNHGIKIYPKTYGSNKGGIYFKHLSLKEWIKKKKSE